MKSASWKNVTASLVWEIQPRFQNSPGFFPLVYLQPQLERKCCPHHSVCWQKGLRSCMTWSNRLNKKGRNGGLKKKGREGKQRVRACSYMCVCICRCWYSPQMSNRFPVHPQVQKNPYLALHEKPLKLDKSELRQWNQIPLPGTSQVQIWLQARWFVPLPEMLILHFLLSTC